MAIVRAHVWASGRVQGVGFRDFVYRQAVPLGVAGFVRNLPDHRVEVVAEGPRPGVEALIDAIRKGPSGASVREVEVVWEAPQGESRFLIRTGGMVHD
ncbi:MAG: acylphosphatase [Armatimonadota bacterium]|nr:acylphosphatase [Armatimonadota bacterium]